MKKKALATRMAAFVMAGAMTMAMGFPALAVETDDLNISFKKTINNVNSIPEKVKAPVTEFGFSVIPSEAITLKNGTESIYVYKGLANGVSLANDKLSINAANTTGYVEGNVIIHKNVFTGKPGVYHYLVSETPTDPAYDGMEYTTLKYDLYVIVDVENNVSTIITKRESDEAQTEFSNLDEGKAGQIEFVNNYTTNNLTVRKNVTGNQGDKSKKFTFNINVNGAADEQYIYEIYTVNDEGTIQGDATSNGILISGATATPIELTHNQEVVIYGLSNTDTYTVNEQSYTDEGYTTKVDNTVGSESSGSIASDKIVIFENNKHITTPTGIVTEYAPYILLVAAAGTFAVLFLRKRKEEF